jgi:Fe-S oxidoreductase/electron transfer flavoprotein alpha/beta subunit
LEQQTREIFWSIGPTGFVVFYAIGFAAMAIFACGLFRHLVKYSRGRPSPVRIDLANGFRRMLADVGSHRTVGRRDRLTGVAHFLVFVGFMIGAAGTTIIFIDYDIVRPITGEQRWRGAYYLSTSFLLDIGHLGLIVGLLYLLIRRGFFRLSKLSYARRYRGESDLRPIAKQWRVEDWVFLISLLIIECTGFLQEGVRLLMDKPLWDDLSPIGGAVARLLAFGGMSAGAASEIRHDNWWLHGVFALLFTAAFPWYKAKHVLSVVGSLALRDDKPLRRLPKEQASSKLLLETTSAAPASLAARVGLASVSDLSWREMLHLDACTKCGRCHEACPARQSDRPLSPRDLILDLRALNDKTQGRDLGAASLIANVVAPETLWACMSCGACQEICPVGIEQPPLIVQMRRHLVDQDVMEPQLRSIFGAVAQTGNSFAEHPRRRTQWTQHLSFEVKDIRNDSAEVLWFVGDYASFDPRNQKVSQTVATLLHEAGVDFALLHEGEWTAGNDIRRAGEEGLFETIVEHNLDAMAKAKKFSRIITTDPHSYNTIRNEYPEFGAVAPIDHYSTLLLELLQSGRLKVDKPLGKRVTFHDPCHLGRLNKGYDPPREVLAAIGCQLVEMPRNRDNSFCCGAGGGRIWMSDAPGAPKPSISRMHEAAALGGIDIFVTCCPKDLTMYEDARKTSGHERSFVVSDLAELVAQAIARKKDLLPELPVLMDRIVDAIAARIGDVVSARIAEAIARPPSMPPTTVSLNEGVPFPAPAPPSPAGPGLVAPEPSEATSRSIAPPSGEPAADLRSKQPLPQLAPMNWGALKPLRSATLPPYEVPDKIGLRILVPVKHVGVLGDDRRLAPDERDVADGVLEYAMNEWDDLAVEEALRLVERLGGGEVVAVTIGAEGAETTLRKALAKGVTRGVRVWSDELSGTDPLTLARTLAAISNAERPDLILCGVQSSDQANGATGVALAAVLKLPHAAVAVGLEWSGAGDITVTRELEGGVRERIEIPSPAVISIQSGINVPRYATMRMIKDAKRKTVAVVDAAGVVDGSGGYVVRRMFEPEIGRAEMLGRSPAEAAAFVAQLIRKWSGAKA